MSKLDFFESFQPTQRDPIQDIEMDELPDDLVYPTPPLNKEQLLDIEEIFKDLIHGGSAFESAPPSVQDLTDRFKSQNTPSGIDSVGSAPSPGTSSSSSAGGSPGASSPGTSSSPNSPDPILREKIEKMAAQFDIDPDEYCEELKQMNQEQFSKCQYIKKEIKRQCTCQFYFPQENELEMWSDRGHMQILLADDTAIYKQASNSTKSEIGVILISDTMGSELRGSRQVMELFAENGINIVKPMLFEKNADHLDFLKLLLSFYGQIPNPQVSKKFQEDVIPAVVKNSQNFLKNQGCKYISLLGVCWGGLVTQKIISTDDSFTSMVSIDGLYYDKDFSAKSPSLFLIGNEPHREQTFEAMEEVMWSNNLAPWDMQRLGAPFGHGFIMSCLSGCPNLNPTVGNLMASIPGCTLKFQKLMSEARLKLDQAATFILKFSSQD